MMKYVIILTAIAVCGCSLKESEEARMARGELRKKLFDECMEMAIRMPRQSDDDVHKIIGKCDDVAYYQSANMTGGKK